MSTSRFTNADLQAWYVCFDPAGSMGNVHFLFPRHTEWQASVGARKLATMLEQPNVTLKRLRGNKR